MGWWKRALCLFRGHQWRFQFGTYLDGKNFPSIDMYACERCRERKSELFNGGV